MCYVSAMCVDQDAAHLQSADAVAQTDKLHQIVTALLQIIDHILTTPDRQHWHSHHRHKAVVLARINTICEKVVLRLRLTQVTSIHSSTGYQ